MNYFMKKAGNIYTKGKTKSKRANLILTLNSRRNVAKWFLRYELLNLGQLITHTLFSSSVLLNVLNLPEFYLPLRNVT